MIVQQIIYLYWRTSNAWAWKLKPHSKSQNLMVHVFTFNSSTNELVFIISPALLTIVISLSASVLPSVHQSVHPRSLEQSLSSLPLAKSDSYFNHRVPFGKGYEGTFNQVSRSY